MALTRSADLEVSHIGKPKDHQSFFKLVMNLDVMQRILYYVKSERLKSRNLLIGHLIKLFSFGKSSWEGSTPGYSCYKSLNAIKSRINTLWEEYCTTQAWNKRNSDEQTNASKIYMAKLESLV